jgi:hypothetical protein
MNIEIEDYSLTDLFVQFTINAEKDQPNFFEHQFSKADVIDAAIYLDVINRPDDYDNGQNGQEMRLGYFSPAFKNQMANKYYMTYFTYEKIVCEFDADQAIMILKYLATYSEAFDNKVIEESI